MIVLFTDYGHRGPYLGHIYSVLGQIAPENQIITLMADAPRNNPRASAYLLASFTRDFPDETIFFSVVDPGVGSNEDIPVIVRLDNQWFVGPNNGIFDIITRWKDQSEFWHISWKPDNLSNTFHGRDLYAPVCGMLANNQNPPGTKFNWCEQNMWPDDLYEIIYIDHFGNVMTGIRIEQVKVSSKLNLKGQLIPYAKYFSDIKPGQLFWYGNSYGLIEIAVNQGNAADTLGLVIGDSIITL